MISNSTLQAKKLATPQAFLSSAERTFVVYQEEAGASITTVRERIKPAKPKAERKRTASGSKGNKMGTEKARALRLLKSLAKVYEFRSPNLFRSRRRVALLTIAGNLLAVVAEQDKRELELADLQRWARKRVAGATHAEIEGAFEAASRAHRGIPSPQDIGFELELNKHDWFSADRPWGVHPADMTEEDVKEAQRKAKRAKDALSAAEKRAAAGATPRQFSKANIARKLGISPPTLNKRMAALGFDNAAAFYDFVAPTYKDNKHRCDETAKLSSKKPSASGHKAASQSAQSKKPRRGGKERRADKRRALPGPAQATAGSQAANSDTDKAALLARLLGAGARRSLCGQGAARIPSLPTIGNVNPRALIHGTCGGLEAAQARRECGRWGT